MFKLQKFPEIGKTVTFNKTGLPDGPTALFDVVDVDRGTGCIYLRAHDDARAREVLTIKVKDKHGHEVEALEFAWMPRLGQFAVNVEWDAWQKGVVFLEEFFARLSDLNDE